MKNYLGILFLFFSLKSVAQKVTGTVFTAKGDLLPYSSITIKGSSIGASANNDAKFSFALVPGNYTLVCQHIGYASQEKNITMDDTDQEVTFILSEQQLDLKEVIVKSGGEDPAYEIIRQTIKKRAYYKNQIQSIQCDLYEKDLIKLRNLPQKILGQKIPKEDRWEMGLDSAGKGVVYLSESIATIFLQQPDKFKMDVKSSRVSGSGSFGFAFPAFISLYNNNVTVFSERLNPRGFISPIADAALHFYHYKYLGSFWENQKEIHTIQVIPRRNYEPLFSGVITIVEDDWRIHSADLILTKKSQLEVLDTLQISQIYIPVSDKVWQVKNQLLHFNFKQFKIDAVGNFVNVYTNYKVNPVFAKKFFDKIIIRYDTAVNKKTPEYWDSVRPIPLSPEEQQDYRLKDSVYQLQKDSGQSAYFLDSLNKQQKKIKPLHIFWRGINRKKYKKNSIQNWQMSPLLKSLEYNTVEGLVLKMDSYYSQNFETRKQGFAIQPHLRYGCSNQHLNAWVEITYRTRESRPYRVPKRETWSLSGGKRVSQFNAENPISALSNSINTLFWNDNFMKIYENYFGGIGFAERFENGIRLNVFALYEDRIPINNTTDFVLIKNTHNVFTPNYPYEKMDTQFVRHQALQFSIVMSFRPGEKYVQFPDRKISTGSKYPLFTITYSKGVDRFFGSDVDFDKWRLTISDDKNFKLGGTLKYKTGIGGFINRNKVFIQDFQHFNGNRSTSAGEYVNSFQVMGYYTNSTIASLYGFSHLEHHFNGLLTNKIPLLKKWNWNFVAGSNILYVNQQDNQIELFAGLENMFKFLRVDVVTAYANGNKVRTGIRIGAGGTVSGAVRPGPRSVAISLAY